MSQFPQLDTHPGMNPGSVIQGDRWRIGVITESLIRLEWQDDGVFEDHATQMVVNRDWNAAPQFTQTVRDGLLIVDTPALRLTYDMEPFSKEGLSVVVKGIANSQMNTWHYGESQRGNLRGTARTLDEVDGETELGLGVISHDGWAVIDDSASNVIVEADTVKGEANPFGTWVVPRANQGQDLYVFGYGHRYIEAVQDFYRLTGPTPLLPRFTMGNWWSRYHRYTEAEYLELIDRFEHEGPRPSSTWTGIWSTTWTPSTARAGPAIPGTATSSPIPSASCTRCATMASRPRSTCTRATASARSRTATPRPPSIWASIRPAANRSSST